MNLASHLGLQLISFTNIKNTMVIYLQAWASKEQFTTLVSRNLRNLGALLSKHSMAEIKWFHFSLWIWILESHFCKILRILYFKECSYCQLDNITKYVIKNIIVSIILQMMLNL